MTTPVIEGWTLAGPPETIWQLFRREPATRRVLERKAVGPFLADAEPEPFLIWRAELLLNGRWFPDSHIREGVMRGEPFATGVGVRPPEVRWCCYYQETT